MEASGQLHASAALPPGKKAVVRWLGGRVHTRANLSVLDKRQISLSYRDSNTIQSIA